ncbi:hypothetical protein GXW74_12925 [Roseomonas eburnea]|uniref:Thioesterase domain-containing protein n=1 Tax=Neoroseomonas eburnea TaxID=1346889 RepID=A0A9X9XCF6_9PROT|nr:hypothetical protein [Neoroseomonas eburnea]MBR0681392.1 hypothetical protein [Neoroseomonas eburnea]
MTTRPRLGRRALLFLPPALAGCSSGIGESLPGPPRARIVLFRGIAEISTGFDDFARRLRDASYSASVHSHLAAEHVAERLVRLDREGRLPRPLCIGGHSLGADAAIEVSGELWTRSLATDALFTLDPVLVGTVAPGPRRVTNFYQAHNGFGRPLAPRDGFTGPIENIELSGEPGLGHFNMDASPLIQQAILVRIRALTGS